MKAGLFFIVLAVAMSACSTTPSAPPSVAELQGAGYETLYLGADGRVMSTRVQAAKKQEGGYWEGDGMSGSPSIVIDLGRQEAIFYKGGQVAGVSPISSGREGYATPTGSYRIIQKNRDHVSNLYGNYVDSAGNVVVKNVGVMRDPRPAGTRFQGAPMPYFMRIVGAVGMHAGYLPGVPDSHGCIRLPEDMAAIYFANAPAGTPVSVRY